MNEYSEQVDNINHHFWQICWILNEKSKSMKEKMEYRSAIRSRERIRAAYAQLINEKNTTAISVKEVVQRAGINRSTFYAHYQDIYAVLEEIEAGISQKMFAFLDVTQRTELPNSPLSFLTSIGADLEQNKDFYRLLLAAHGSTTFIHTLKEAFFEQMVNESKVIEKATRPQEFLISMRVIVNGMVMIFSDWVMGKVQMPMPDLVNILNNVAISAMREYV